MNNSFEQLCKFASDNDWCWRLHCTTCGHVNFRRAFYEVGRTGQFRPDNWGQSGTYGPGSALPVVIQNDFLAICAAARIESIAAQCRFPDWLGYLGLALSDARGRGPVSEAYWLVSQRWAKQLVAVLAGYDESSSQRLTLAARGLALLDIADLEAVETVIARKHSESALADH